ncbi:MAG TPA: D-alanyl-D-alanine carboxypeptidase family protein [Methyloceanibacter sp.]|nr:D-alanyl-D-alanine carboxypeptidase family protein [Methyloceanibacter sp.]
MRLDRWIKLTAAAAVFVMTVASTGAVAREAAAPPGNFETKAKHAILMDADANLVLFEKDADALVPPASMSKLMTLAVVFRELKAGHIKLETEFPVSEHAWRTGGAPSGSSAMFAPLNSKVTVSDLIQGVTVQSGNDAAIILAEGVSGSEDAFAKEMNKYAREIGLTKSNFVNATGLPADGHVMTARELAMLARYLIYTYPEYYHFFGEPEFKYRDKFVFRNRNPLIFEPDLGVDGMKTGYIEEAGYGLVASAKRGDQRLILVVNGLESKQEREGEPRKLIEWGFKSFKPFRLFDQGEKVSDALVWGGTQHYVPLVGDGNINIILPATSSGKVSASVVYQGPIKAPIRKGDRVAVLRITSAESSATNDIPLYAGDDIDQSNFAMRGLDSLLVLAFGWLL